MEVRREIWAGNADLGLIHLGTMGLDYIPQGQCSLRRDRNLRNSHINEGTSAEAEKEPPEVFGLRGYGKQSLIYLRIHHPWDRVWHLLSQAFHQCLLHDF